MSNDQDNMTVFGVDLDANNFLKTTSEIKSKLKEAFDTETLSSWMNLAQNSVVSLGLLAAAAMTAKAAFDLTIEGETIKKVNDQFEILTKNAGISSETLKEGLEKSVHGLMDQTSLLESANKALVELGTNAKRLPEIMELARNVTKVFGGNLKDRFDQISQAIATGQTRMLKQMGLTIDADKAMKTYAKSIGETADVLNEQGKQTAILNAVLETGNKRFKDLKTQGETVTAMVKTAKVAWTEFKEELAKWVEKSGIVKGALGAVRDVLSGVTMVMKDMFKKGVEDTGAAVKKAQDQVSTFTDQLIQAQMALEKAKSEQHNGIWDFFFGADPKAIEKEVLRLQNKLFEAKENLAKETEKLEGENKPKEEPGLAPSMDVAPETTKNTGVDLEKKLQKKAAFEKEILQISENRLKMEMDLEEDAEMQRMHIMTEREMLEAQYEARMSELRAKALDGGVLGKRQADMLIMQLEDEKALKIAQLREQEDEKVARSYDNRLKHAENYWDGFAKAAAKSNNQAWRDTKNFGARGEQAFQSLSNHAISAFMKMGEGTQDAGEIMKGFMFGTIADIAEAEGKLMFMRSVWPPQPPGLAGGAALLALAGFLRSQANGKSSSSGGGDTGGGGGSSSTGVTPVTDTKPTAAPAAAKAVTLQVMGNYFETEQTKTRLMEMMREATDATDFKYVQIGQH